ncbi:unnamed protein product [Thelazia callipaeda]|uniref:Serpentine receptor class gamma n=1 Tax=Thelazia callipaeda TaxID=103827 RepID=A0A0N5CSS6_THECL|nr:unnamed protein product [Thelazia callipaeda]
MKGISWSKSKKKLGTTQQLEDTQCCAQNRPRSVVIRSMAESLIHFVAKCFIYLITVVMFSITTVIFNQSIIAVAYFAFFGVYCTTLQTSITFFLRHSVFFWYMLIILIFIHIVLLADHYIIRYEMSASEIFLSPLTVQNPIKLPHFCIKHIREFGRVLLIISLRLIDTICALSLAFCAIHKAKSAKKSKAENVSLVSIPFLIVAILFSTPISEKLKRLLCLFITQYVIVITNFKLIFDAYKGFTNYPNFCANPESVEWLYWIGLISDNTKPALVYFFNFQTDQQLH